ncbi:hypothetical protein Godav_004810 [Gossypium davidsonii]|uniref:Uncharacterized protein n=1 Tax=Gossypium davidsonii TaxID=34287 RepID=A0A7J8SNA3_GOSDV|nr:hypothetical protein [Gossypium davidsonii]
MDHNQHQNVIVGVAASVLAFGAVWIKILKTTKEIASHPRVNRDYERENYINLVHPNVKEKNVQESVVDEQIKFVGEQLGRIANALKQFTADKTPQLYEEVMSMEEEGFDDDFLCSVFDYLVEDIDTFMCCNISYALGQCCCYYMVYY